MRIIRDLTPDVQFNRPIVTLGTYDGVHLGHQAIIREMVAEAQAKGKESVLLTFDPHPRMVLYPESHSRMRIKCEQNRFFSFGLSFCNHFTDNGLVSEMNTIIGSQCHNGPIELNVWSKITNYAHNS